HGAARAKCAQSAVEAADALLLCICVVLVWHELTADLRHSTPSSLAASAVPRTRERILPKATSRERDVSSPKGANPQSSVVPNRSRGMYSAASSTRSLT